LPDKAECQPRTCKDGCGSKNLKHAQPDELLAHFPKHGRLQLKANQKQHHHHAKLGEMLHFGRLRPDDTKNGTNHNASDEIT
jgi:hypothetical protein